jgi:hypothetical protein
LLWAILEAGGQASSIRQAIAAGGSEKEQLAPVASWRTGMAAVFGRPAGQPEDGYEASLDQALYLGNAELVLSFVRTKTGSLAERLAALADPAALADELFLSVYSRPPSAEETALVAEHLAAAPAGERPRAVEDLVWAAVASAEFRFNH